MSRRTDGSGPGGARPRRRSAGRPRRAHHAPVRRVPLDGHRGVVPADDLPRANHEGPGVGGCPQRCSTQEQASRQQGRQARSTVLGRPRCTSHAPDASGEEGQPAKPAPELHEHQRRTPGRPRAPAPARSESGGRPSGEERRGPASRSRAPCQSRCRGATEARNSHTECRRGRPPEEECSGAEGSGEHPGPHPVRHDEVVAHVQRPGQVPQRAVGEDQVTTEPEPLLGEEVQPDDPGGVQSSTRGVVAPRKAEPSHEQKGPHGGQAAKGIGTRNRWPARARGRLGARRHARAALSADPLASSTRHTASPQARMPSMNHQ